MITPVPMAKIAIVGAKDKLAPTIETLHRLHLLHIDDYDSSDEFFDLGTPLEGGSRIAERLVRLRGLIKGADMSPPEDVRPFTVDNLHALEAKLQEVEDELLRLVGERDKLRDEAKSIDEQTATLARIANLTLPLRLISGYRTLATIAGFVPPDADLSLLSRGSSDVEVLESREAEGRFIVAFAPKEAERALQDAASRLGLQTLEVPPLPGTPREERVRLEERRQQVTARTAELEEKIASIRERHAAAFFALDEHLGIESDKSSAPVRFRTTPHSFMIEGWIPHDQFARLEQTLARSTQNSVYVTRSQRASRRDAHGPDAHSEHHGEESHAEEAPVMLKNLDRAGAYELLTDTYARPKYTEVDPTLFMYFGFPFFFGFMLGDVGYGAVILLLVLTGVFRRVYDFFGFQSFRHLNRIFIHSALLSIVFGFLYGEFFGLELFGHEGIISHFETHFGPFPYPLARLANVKLLLALTLLIGALHMFIGLLVGFRNAAADHGIGDAFKHRGSWLGILLAFTFAGIAGLPDILGLGHVSYPLPLYALSGLFFVAGVVLLLMGEGAIALMELPTVISNLLSYTRLLAIGLSGVGIALAGNKVAEGMIHGEIPGGLVGAVVVAIIFHGLGIALGVLGPALHSLRLHYVEFFTKFYQGGGTPYQPFGTQRKYTKQEVKAS